MIQRIQSIFLLLAGGASLALFGLPLASSNEAGAAATIFEDSKFTIFDSVGLLIFFGIAGALALISIFLFKNRTLQMRLSIFAIIANLLGTLFGVIYFMQNSNAGISESAVISDGAGAYLPIVAIVFAFLGYRFISKDEKLVRSMDRLR